MSVAELARRAEVSAPFVSQLESGHTSLSLGTLYRIAAGLGCTPNALLGPATERPHVTRAGTGRNLTVGQGTHPQHPRLLSRTGPGVMLEAYHYLIRPDEDAQEWFEHPGEDFVYVISGCIAVVFEDGTELELCAGDAVHHGGTVPHSWEIRSGGGAEVLLAVAAPPEPDGDRAFR